MFSLYFQFVLLNQLTVFALYHTGDHAPSIHTSRIPALEEVSYVLNRYWV
jgi:hypothetical protein